MSQLKRPDQYPFLDLIRIVAALMVAFGHIRGLYFVGFQSVEESNVFLKAFYLISGLQHEAVIAFFIISGFLVGGGALQAFQEGRFSFPSYSINRVSRIYIVFLPALILTAAVSWLGTQLFSDTRFYSEVPLIPSGVGQSWHWSQVPCHLVMLQTFYCRVAAFNPPLWSLSFEWLLYFMFPMLLYTVFIRAGLATRITLAIFFMALVFTASPTVRLWYEWPLFWLLGVFAAHVNRSIPQAAPTGWIALGLCLIPLMISRLHVVPLWYTDVGFAVLLAMALAAPAICRMSVLTRPIRYGAGFSYSIYVLHLPLAVFIGAIAEILGFPATLAQPGLTSFTAFAATMLLVLIISDIFSHLTERRTQKLRRYLKRRFLSDAI